MSAPFVPSPLQQAVFDDAAHGVGHTIVVARAGSGKTTTIMESLRFIPRGLSIGLFAFNRSIAQELQRRVPRGVDAKTLHAHGYKACARAFQLGDDAVRKHKVSELVCPRLFGPPVARHPVRGYYREIEEAVTKAKDTLFPLDGVDERTGSVVDVLGAMDVLCDRFGVGTPPPDVLDPETCLRCQARAPETERCPSAGVPMPHAFPEVEYDADGNPLPPRSPRQAFLEACIAALRACRSEKRPRVIDYSDMCWLPVVHQLRVWQYDRVLVDETQDLSPCQIELLMCCVRRGGRITVIGDPAQALYGFRGADEHTIDVLEDRLNAKVLPLSVTYRCCRAVVDLARREVPDLIAAPGAPQGRVDAADTDQLVSRSRPGDMVVSRSNAPLFGLCWKLLLSGKRAAVKGRDIGDGVCRFIERFDVATVLELVAAATAWRDAEVERLEALNRDLAPVVDRFECVVALTEGETLVLDVLAKARRLFISDKAVEDGDVDQAELIVLGTTHKLKGLEADRVWMLEDTYRPEKGGEEGRCWYVAVTRAKTQLFLTRRKDDELGRRRVKGRADAAA